ncbi:FAD-binding protein [Nonomuraea phyllanthi]|uniref:FAD-binding protein n=1 Tax=Nonomuraea phyllanthi TaxID=2219224 RepID=A0A5C4V1W4_9ACTN|nr:FAD-dependent oxidoreductase [Nonomuraea phyllanthi]KAB8185179.1 FAD-binding protein [Nonomuraea phyllanthi]
MTRNLFTAPPELEGRIVTPEDPRYLLLYSTCTTADEPAAVLLPESTAEVSAALRFVRERGLPLTVRGGGHDVPGRAVSGGAVIDLSAMNRVEVLDRRSRLVRVEAGARWPAVAQALAPYGLAIGSRDHDGAGAGGLAAAGGIGRLVRQYGLMIDHVRAAEVVLADGTAVHADAEHEPDLLWAVRGAGSGVGIVVAYEIEAMELSDVGYAQIAVEIKRNGHALQQWADYMESATRELTSTVTLQSHGSALIASVTAVVADAGTDHLRTAVEPLLRLGTRLLDLHVQLTPYPALLSAASPSAAFPSAASPSSVSASSGQWPGTTANGLIEAMTDGAADLAAAWYPLSGRLDAACAGFESRSAAFARIYPGKTGDRVTRLWARYDPDGIFRTP